MDTMIKYDYQAIEEDHKCVILKSLLCETNPKSWIQPNMQYTINGKIKLDQYN